MQLILISPNSSRARTLQCSLHLWYVAPCNRNNHHHQLHQQHLTGAVKICHLLQLIIIVMNALNARKRKLHPSVRCRPTSRKSYHVYISSKAALFNTIHYIQQSVLNGNLKSQWLEYIWTQNSVYMVVRTCMTIEFSFALHVSTVMCSMILYTNFCNILKILARF